ncbi:MAG: DUF456 domain-containing protein [Bacteroidales bacterium]|nr:DUF456 domain-containing protein [Bacteroidales bacterium]
MDILWSVISGILVIVGVIGCVIPIIPGPAISFSSLLLLQLKSNPPFTSDFLIWLGIIMIIVTALDYVVPAYGTKKLGGSKSGIRGSIVGLIFGIFLFPPIGIIIGPFIGAVIGELMIGKSSNVAFRSGLGSFIGFLSGTLIKLIYSFVVGYYFVESFF